MNLHFLATSFLLISILARANEVERREDIRFAGLDAVELRMNFHLLKSVENPTGCGRIKPSTATMLPK